MNPAMLITAIDSALANSIPVYTDCIGSVPVSRVTIFQGNINNRFFNDYDSETVMIRTMITGTKSVSLIKGRRNK
jgi:hypothetical protein